MNAPATASGPTIAIAIDADEAKAIAVVACERYGRACRSTWHTIPVPAISATVVLFLAFLTDERLGPHSLATRAAALTAAIETAAGELERNNRMMLGHTDSTNIPHDHLNGQFLADDRNKPDVLRRSSKIWSTPVAVVDRAVAICGVMGDLNQAVALTERVGLAGIRDHFDRVTKHFAEASEVAPGWSTLNGLAPVLSGAQEAPVLPVAPPVRSDRPSDPPVQRPSVPPPVAVARRKL